ncbi:hypothetical protein CR513_00148, partial [Mucuna pruriens]
MCARRAERDQVAIEKERLEKTLLDSQRREDEQREQFRQLQEKMHLLEEELARANLSKEHLKEQGCKSLLELVRTRTRAEEDEAQLKEAIRGLREAVEGWRHRCQDIANNAEEQVNVATAETASWKDKFFKLASLANLALKDIPRGLQAAEGMADFMKLPREITGFLGLYREFYDQIKAMAKATHAPTRRALAANTPAPTPEKEAEEFLKIIRHSEYQFLDQMNKTQHDFTPISATQL